MAKRSELSEQVREHLDVLTDRLCEVEAGDWRPGLVSDLDKAYGAAIRAAHRTGEERSPSKVTAAIVELDEVVSARVKHLRNEAGRTQAALAKDMARIGFDWKRQTVADIETGKRKVSMIEMFGVAMLFGEPVARLLDPGADYVRFPPRRSFSRDQVLELLLGDGGSVEPGGQEWELPAHLATADTSDDWRPAVPLWRRRAQGYGQGARS